MPKVNGEEFPYTKEGKKAAKEAELQRKYREQSKRARKAQATARKESLDMSTDPATGKPMEMTEEDYNYAKGGKVRGAGVAQKGVRKCKMR